MPLRRGSGIPRGSIPRGGVRDQSRATGQAEHNCHGDAVPCCNSVISRPRSRNIARRPLARFLRPALFQARCSIRMTTRLTSLEVVLFRGRPGACIRQDMQSRRGSLQRWSRNQGWIAALLAVAFAIRALIPLGFMPMVGPNFTIRLEFCAAYAPVAATDPHAARHHHHGGASGPVGSSPSDHSTCPFGASPAPATLLQAALPVFAPQLDSGPLVSQSPVSRPTTSYRTQAPRGPPGLA